MKAITLFGLLFGYINIYCAHFINKQYDCFRMKYSIIESSENNSKFVIKSLEDPFNLSSWMTSSPVEKYNNSNNNSADLNNSDGLAIVVVHEVTGQILLEKVFPTWNAFAFSYDLLWWMERIQKGRIIVMFIKKTGIYGLSKAIKYFMQKGSLFIDYLPPNSLWIWVWILGGKTLTEIASPSDITNHHNNNNNNNNNGLLCHLYLTLSRQVELKHNSQINAILKDFCDNVEGMGDTCQTEQLELEKLSYKMHKIKKKHHRVKTQKLNLIHKQFNYLNNYNFKWYFNEKKEHQIGIVICAGSRFQYLNEALKSLFLCPDLKKENVFVVVGINFWSGKPDQNTINLLNILGLSFKIVLSHNYIFESIHAKQFNFLFYKRAWTAALSAFPDKQYIAFIDEDVTVEKDWLRFMAHAAPILSIDKSIWCVTGTAANGLGVQPNYLMRGWRQVGWGYLILREEVSKTLKIWPETPTYSTLYDSWLLREVTKDRECVFPSVSHTHHFGIGLNIIPYLHDQYFINDPITDGNTKDYTPISHLTKSYYEQFVSNSIKESKVLNNDPCAIGFLNVPDNFSNYVFYFRLTDQWEAPEWTFLAECIGTWPYSTHGMHQGTMQIPLKNGNKLWLVGVPLSPYSIYKPLEYQVWTPDDEFFVEKQINFTSALIKMPSFVNKSFEILKTNLFR